MTGSGASSRSSAREASRPWSRAPRGRTPAVQVTFEWLPGGGFLVERWEVPFPGVPNGVAVIGFNPDRGAYLQHQFDSRGVARVYEMGFADGVWTLARGEPDFWPLDFHQRWSGTFSPDGNTITGRWESSSDGADWEHDFGLRYERIA